jgi:hypothetical protein
LELLALYKGVDGECGAKQPLFDVKQRIGSVVCARKLAGLEVGIKSAVETLDPEDRGSLAALRTAHASVVSMRFSADKQVEKITACVASLVTAVYTDYADVGDADQTMALDAIDLASALLDLVHVSVVIAEHRALSERVCFGVLRCKVLVAARDLLALGGVEVQVIVDEGFGLYEALAAQLKEFDTRLAKDESQLGSDGIGVLTDAELAAASGSAVKSAREAVTQFQKSCWLHLFEGLGPLVAPVEVIKHGMLDGSNWRTGIQDSWTVEEIVAHVSKALFKLRGILAKINARRAALRSKSQ